MPSHRLNLVAAILLLSAASSEHSFGQVESDVEILSFNSTWGWLMILDENGEQVDPVTRDPAFLQTWFTRGFNTLTFRQDPGPLSYGGILLLQSSLIPRGTSMPAPAFGRRGTVYFRIAFDLEKTLTNLRFDLLANDGLILYVDGVRWFVMNMPHPFSSSAFDTLAATFGNDSRLTTITSADGGLTPLPSLAPGFHTIHVSLHNASFNSSNLGFALRLAGDLEPPPPPPPPPPPSLSATISIPSPDGSPRVLFTARDLDPASTYFLQVSTDLVHWLPLETFPSLEERTTFTFDVPANQAHRYYRLGK